MERLFSCEVATPTDPELKTQTSQKTWGSHLAQHIKVGHLHLRITHYCMNTTKNHVKLKISGKYVM